MQGIWSFPAWALESSRLFFPKHTGINLEQGGKLAFVKDAVCFLAKAVMRAILIAGLAILLFCWGKCDLFCRAQGLDANPVYPGGVTTSGTSRQVRNVADFTDWLKSQGVETVPVSFFPPSLFLLFSCLRAIGLS